MFAIKTEFSDRTCLNTKKIEKINTFYVKLEYIIV